MGLEAPSLHRGTELRSPQNPSVWGLGTERSLPRPQDIPELDVKRLDRGDIKRGKATYTVICSAATCMGNWERSETDVSTWNDKVAEVALAHSEPGSSCPLDRTEDPEGMPGLTRGVEKSPCGSWIPQTGTPGLTGRSDQTAVTEQLEFTGEAQRMVSGEVWTVRSHCRSNRVYAS